VINNDLPPMPDMVQTNYTHNIYKNSRVYLRSSITNASFFFTTKIIKCSNFTGRVFDLNKQITTEIFADEASIDEKNKTITLNGNVRLVSHLEETTVYSEQMNFDYDKEILLINTDVVIEKDDGSYLKATSMKSDLKEQTNYFTNLEMKFYYEEDEEEENE